MPSSAYRRSFWAGGGMSERSEETSETPEEMVAAVVRRLDGLDDVEIDEHPSRFEAVHHDLRRVLRGEFVSSPS